MRKPIGKIKNLAMAKRVRRKLSTRKRVVGTAERPRVCISKTNKHISAQVIDDTQGKTLFSVQTFGKKGVSGKANKDGAKLVGAKLAEQLKGAKINKIVLDRSGYQYSGIVSVFAQAVREQSIDF